MHPVRALGISLFAVLIAAGCGGGGGGGGATSVSVPVLTNWVAVPGGTVPGANIPYGPSERITVHPINSLTTTTKVVNVSVATNPVSSSIGLAPGKYVYHADLYSAAGQTGTIVGSLDAVVDTSVTSSVNIVVGDVMSGIVLGPVGADVAIGATGYVYAGPTASAGVYTFAPPNDLSFASSSTATLTVTRDTTDPCAGDVSGVASGAVNITATSASTSVASTPLSYTVATGSGAKVWTIMVFLNASNNLNVYALANYLQMQEAATHGSNTQILVAWKESRGNTNALGGYDWQFSGNDDTRYYLVQPSGGGSIVGNPVKDLGAGIDFGVTSSVNNFVTWCKKNYPATHYLLDMWDHGDGWQEYLSKRPKAVLFRGISYDFETNNHIDSWQMDQCFTGGNNVDLLAYDACNMQMLECGYQVRNYVSYIVGSEDTTPGPGYDYSVALLPFFTTPSGATATLARGFVDQMVDDTSSGGIYAGQALCQSVVDAGQMTAVAAAVDAFGQALLANKSSIGSIVDSARANAKNYNDIVDNPYNMYYDAVSLATTIENSTGVPTAVSAAAANVITATNSSVLYSRYDLANMDAGSNGLAIDFSNATTFNALQDTIPSAATQYANLQFAKDYPHWYDWLLVAP
jgi:hypothetical protein